MHIIIVPDQTQSSQAKQNRNLRCGVLCKVSFGHFLDHSTVCGAQKAAELTKIMILGPKVCPNEHSQTAVPALVVEECKCPTVVMNEIALLDGSGGIKAEQVSQS